MKHVNCKKQLKIGSYIDLYSCNKEEYNMHRIKEKNMFMPYLHFIQDLENKNNQNRGFLENMNNSSSNNSGGCFWRNAKWYFDQKNGIRWNDFEFILNNFNNLFEIEDKLERFYKALKPSHVKIRILLDK